MRNFLNNLLEKIGINTKEKKRFLIIIFLLTSLIILIVFILELRKLPDGKLHLVFCNVGQGDGIYIVSPMGKDILIDGGPNERILECLAKNMPFWDRKIDLVFATHEQADHITGLTSVVNKYEIGAFFIGESLTDIPEYLALKKVINAKKIKTVKPYRGGKVSFADGVILNILWPEKKWLAGRIRSGENKVLGVGSGEVIIKTASYQGDLNETSTVLWLKYKNFDALLTGDADSRVQESMANYVKFTPVEVLKVPHHGSKVSLSEKFLKIIKPKLAVISVGKNNFGHPAKELLNILSNSNIKIMRTDQKGDITIKTDGEKWNVL